MINWREIPLVRALVFFIVGILLALFLNITIPGLSYLLVVLSIFILVQHFSKTTFTKRWQFGALLYALLLTMGYHIGFHYQEINDPAHFSYATDENPYYLTGKIIENPKKANTVKVKLAVTHLGDSLKNFTPTLGNILLALELDSLSNTLDFGDEILVKAKIQTLDPPQNPEAFDYRKLLRFDNIYHRSYIPSGQIQLLAKNTDHGLWSTAKKMQSYCLTQLKTHLLGEREFAVGSALILGYKDELSPELRNSYARTGAMHVLAVSGLHVGIIAGILGIFLGFFKPQQRWQKLLFVLLQISGIWVFAFVSGASPSVLRAATMFSFLVIGLKLERYNNIYNTLAISAFVLLFINPMLILHPGFQLSYLAVLGIVYFQQRIYKIWYIENKLGDYCWSLTSVALAAQLGTFPISIFYFNQFPVYFILSGLVVIPFATLILTLGILVIALGKIPLLGMLIGKIFYGAIWIMNALIFAIEQLPYGVYQELWLGFGSMLLLYLSIVLFAMLLKAKNFRLLLGTLTAIVLFFTTTAFQNIKSIDQKEIVIYHIHGQSCVDFFDGKKSFGLQTKTLAPKTAAWATANNRMSKNIDEVIAINFEDIEYKSTNLYYRNGFVQFYDKKLLFLNGHTIQKVPPALQPDIVVLRENCKVNLEEVQDYLSPKKIVADGSNKKWKIREWKAKADELGIDFIDTYYGAFNMIIKEK